MKPLRKQIHPHPHFREKDRLMYPLHRSHPSPHHLNPIFKESFYPNSTSSDYKKADEDGINNKDGSRLINVSTIKAVNKQRFASFTTNPNNLTRPAADTLLLNLKILLEWRTLISNRIIVSLKIQWKDGILVIRLSLYIIFRDG